MKQCYTPGGIKNFIIPFFLFASISINAQVGIGTTTPAPSAQLEVSSTTKGFLPPRMTQAQRNAIPLPAPGLMVWCSDCGLAGDLVIYNGTAWGKTTGRSGKNYYVSAQGNNDNDGLSISTAWQSLDQVNKKSESFTPGDSILFERGSWFFGPDTIRCFGTDANPIVFGAYGTGEKPVFICAEQIRNNPGWVKKPSLGPNIWEYQDGLITHWKVDVANMILRLNGSTADSFGIKVMSPNASSLTKQGQFLYDWVNHKILFYSVQLPAAIYSEIQIVFAKNAIEFPDPPDKPAQSHYIVFENLDFRYFGACVVQFGGSNCSYRNLDISYIGGGDNTAAQTVHYKARFGNGLQMWGAIHDVTITGCKIDNVYDAGISPQGWMNFPCSVYNLYMRNNLITNCDMSFEFWESSGQAFSYPRIKNENINIHDIYFENNTCVNAGGAWSRNQRFEMVYTPPERSQGSHARLEAFDGKKSNIFIRNNIFYGATNRLYWMVFNNEYDVGNIVSDYNDFWKTKGEYIGGVGDGQGIPPLPIPILSLDGWRQTTNHEINSYNYNPLFVSETDFHLQASSPLIGLGIPLSYGKYMGAYPY